MAAKKDERKKLADFLATPKSIHEVKSLFPALDSPEKIRRVKLPERHSLFETRNERNEPLFVVVASETRPGLRERIWSMWRHQGIHPWIWIQMPHDLPFKELKIVPLSDIHYGARAHSYKRFLEYLKWIEETPNVFTFLNGDILENAIDGSIGGAAYESIMTPDEQVWGRPGDPDKVGMIELLRPIRHKILWSQPGNHEWRTWKKTNIDPGKIICRELDIPYFDEPIFADILAWGQRFTFYCHHGTSGSQTKGGKINNARKPAGFQTPVHFIIMGHVHDSMANVDTVHVPRRKFDENGRVVEHYIEEVPRYTIICPSYHGYFGSYGSRAGYSPGSWGSVSCMLYKEGNYRSSE